MGRAGRRIGVPIIDQEPRNKKTECLRACDFESLKRAAFELSQELPLAAAPFDRANT